MTSFETFNLPPQLNQTLDRIGFVEPTAIQSKAIPGLLKGQDVLACSETGSGKTGAYLIPMLTHLFDNQEAQGLILAPTRELAQQISEFLKTLVPDERLFHTTRLVGGQDIRKQFKSLQRKPRVIVATPGRLIDHLKRNTVQIHKVQHLVLDEADRMIDMGFAPQLKEILRYLPEKRQTSFFTATMDKKVVELTKKYLKNPLKIMLNDSRPVNQIKQSVIQVHFKDKDECILSELNEREGSVIVFLKTKHRTDRLKKYLSDFGFAVDLIHGGRTQGQRNRAIKAFKDGKSRILCATDVAARGIDVPHVEHVINFDLPMQDEDYVHRVGRTARNGATGEAVSLVTPEEERDWNRIVKKYDIPDATIELSAKPRAGKKKNRANTSRGPKKKGSFKRSHGKKKHKKRR
jgi:ATP-dependent RNA helicase DeaD